MIFLKKTFDGIGKNSGDEGIGEAPARGYGECGQESGQGTIGPVIPPI